LLKVPNTFYMAWCMWNYWIWLVGRCSLVYYSTHIHRCVHERARNLTPQCLRVAALIILWIKLPVRRFCCANDSSITKEPRIVIGIKELFPSW